MHRPFVVLVTVATLAAVTACGPDPLPEDHCSVPAAPDVDWHDCDLVRAHLGFDTLTHADLTGANLIRADLGMADLTGADLTGADLVGARLFFTDLTDADLTGADLTGARLLTTLTGANLTGANLTDADFSMDGTAPHLSGAHDPVDATGSPSNTTGVRYENTTCPDGTVVPPGTCW